MTDAELQERVIDIVIEEKIPNFKLNKYENIGVQMQRAKIKALMALINQSNREYGNWLIGEDEDSTIIAKDGTYDYDMSSEAITRNCLRTELRKKNENT